MQITYLIVSTLDYDIKIHIDTRKDSRGNQGACDAWPNTLRNKNM